MEIKFANYGQERDAKATDQEIEIFEILRAMSGREDLRLTRKSDNYVTAALGEWDLARFKYTARAKWISFPVKQLGSEKNRISVPEDVRDFADLVAESIAHIDKYSQ